MKLFTSIALTVAALLSAPSAHAQQVTHDIPYTQLGGGQKADLYQPTGPGPFPAIVYIHGGSWRSGSKNIYKKLATDLAAQGYAGFAIDYDLAPHSFPLAWQQSRDAVLYLRAHAAEYHIDPDRILVAGDSAGGELAALIALAPHGPSTNLSSRPERSAAERPAASGTDLPVAAALIFNGVYRLCSSYHVVTRYLGDDHATVCSDASPYNHVHPNAPPFFIGHGTSDSTVPFSEAQGFTDALRAQNIFVANYVAEGGHHSYWKESKYYAANLAAVESFLKNEVPALNAK